MMIEWKALAATSLAVALLSAAPGMVLAAGQGGEQKAVASSDRQGESVLTRPQREKVEKSVSKAGEEARNKERGRLVEEAIAAITRTREAVALLHQKKTDEALKALEQVAGKLDILLARAPEMALAPVDVQTWRIEFAADLDTVRKARKHIEELVDDGRLQDARQLARDFGSEIHVSVANLPLATYPLAVREAVRLIDAGKIKEAAQVLQAALRNLVITDIVIPLPIMRARAELDLAQELAAKSKLAADERKQLASYLEDAERQIRLAEAFGYGKPRDYRDLKERIARLREAQRSGKTIGRDITSLLARLKELFPNAGGDKQVEADKQAETGKQK